MDKINIDMLRYISEYVQLDKLFETSKIFSSFAKSIRKIYLNKNYVNEYFTNETFRDTICKLIISPDKQLCIEYESYIFTILIIMRMFTV